MLSLAADFTVDGLSYNITSTTDLKVEVTKSLTQPSGNLTIPASVEYGGKSYTVTGIGYQAFNFSFNLTSVIIPNTVTYIAEWAFISCNKLSFVNIPNSVTTIGEVLRVVIEPTSPHLLSLAMPTGIHEVRSKMEEVRGEVYNLQGKRLTRPQKGLNIVNGKMVIIK